MIHLTIDGNPVEVEKGTTILHAAKKIGIKIPTLCYIEDLLPDGSCRLCVVEVKKEIHKSIFKSHQHMKLFKNTSSHNYHGQIFVLIDFFFCCNGIFPAFGAFNQPSCRM